MDKKIIATVMLLLAFLGLALIFYGALKNEMGLAFIGFIITLINLGISVWAKKKGFIPSAKK
ncbi:MAG: hypothetical protein ACP5IJ_01400 [Candidatus Nanoarchaeia archaeon]